ncbi:period circadian protein homolog 1a isoform X2 [Engraulis encrasicolus]|uniref:period circadian protein homolog 1a isoform X2 n=1 Tax=Engraulis encrasicolus TaxID=184585 RepID=UPI002FD10201
MSNANVEASANHSASRGGVGGAEDDGQVGHEPQVASSRRSSGSLLAGGEKKASNGKREARGPQRTNVDDTESSGNDSAERECGGHGRRVASTCSSRNGKDSAMETTESKSSNSNSHSPSPPSSSVAYSMLSGGSSEQDPPSTSGCSSDRPARLQTQRELLRALRELKIRMPPDHRGKGRSSTLASLQYALNCVKQVRANQEYYHQWNVEESHGCCLDLSTFTIEELDNITSEYTLQNTDTFSVAVSFLTGKVVYVSPQAPSRLCCKPEQLQGALFSELLAPQDVSTFYSGTSPSKLPAWPSCNSNDSPGDCAQEKSMFCRISGSKGSEVDVRYSPFRLTPYQLTLRDSDISQPQPCVLLIAERVHSGYEAPRIPDDKRIFTTSHSPSCLFQEVDERAVPLLGYLPQDLVGTPMLYYLHPEDRPLMVAIHRKILQFAGHPFDHSSVRVCARSGEYLTIDTSWSSFINPWSRKVAFIVGRHKVRTSPLNEDVFTPSALCDPRAMSLSPDVAQLSEKIHRLLVQPVHSGSSQGYGSLCSATDQHASTGSSSDGAGPVQKLTSNQPLTPMTFQQMCKDIHMVKTSGQDMFMESRNRPQPCRHSNTVARVTVKSSEHSKEPPQGAGLPALKPPALPTTPPRKDRLTSYSYQQLNCLDSIIRYLGSCNVPNTVKRKCGSSSCTTSSTSDDDKQRQEAAGGVKAIADTLAADGSKPADPTHGLTPLALHCKAESVISTTSLCSFSSTIVHVGDKKPPESDIVMMEEAPTTPTLPPTPTPSTPTPAVSSSPAQPPLQAALSPSTPTTTQPDKEARRAGSSPTAGATATAGGGGSASKVALGLTKEMLSAHTQKEEQAFINRFRDLNKLLEPQPQPISPRRPSATTGGKGVRSSQDYPAVGTSSSRKRGRGGKRRKHQPEGSQAGGFVPPFSVPPPRGPVPQQAELPTPGCFPAGRHLFMGPQTSSSSWPASVGSQASIPPTTVPQYAAPPGCMPYYPMYPGQMPTSQVMPPMAPPVMALILPNYMYPQLNTLMPQMSLAGGVPMNAQPMMPDLNFNQAMSTGTPGAPQHALPQMNPLGTPQFNPAMLQMNPAMNPAAMGQPGLMPSMMPFNLAGMPGAVPQPFHNPNMMYSPFANAASMPTPAAPMTSGLANPFAPTLSRPCTPQSAGLANGDREEADSPLFHSRCSSPLNLVQLEELAGNRAESVGVGLQQTPPPGAGASQGKVAGGVASSVSRSNSMDTKAQDENVDECNQDAMSTSSDLLDLLMQEDSRSGTGSAASGSGSSGSGMGSSGSGSSGSGSNGCSTSGTSGSGTGCSSNTSKYFGSVDDSSENDHSHKQAGASGSGSGGGGGDVVEEQFIKYVLQDPIWLLMANTDDKVMMTYQLPSRDRETVLQQDLAMLKAVQKQQPHFTEQQRKELSQEHPWILTGGIPDAINITSCADCNSTTDDPDASETETFPKQVTVDDHHDDDLPLPEETTTPDTPALGDTAADVTVVPSGNTAADIEALVPEPESSPVPSPAPAPRQLRSSSRGRRPPPPLVDEELEVTSSVGVCKEE